jgi:hypothetical protein
MARPLPEEVKSFYAPQRREQITITTYDAFPVIVGLLLILLALVSTGV